MKRCLFLVVCSFVLTTKADLVVDSHGYLHFISPQGTLYKDIQDAGEFQKFSGNFYVDKNGYLKFVLPDGRVKDMRDPGGFKDFSGNMFVDQYGQINYVKSDGLITRLPQLNWKIRN